MPGIRQSGRGKVKSGFTLVEVLMVMAILGLVIIAGQLAPETARSETLYVIDRLLVGVYPDESLTGTALEVLPTGASLEILARQGEHIQVRTGNDIEGWVDSNYLMREKPAQLLLLEAETALEKTRERLQEAERQIRTLVAGGTGLVSSGISGAGFPSRSEPLPPPLTARQWIFLIFSFLLALSVGGLLIYGMIHRRYYLLDR